jgi:two-component system C4-dicarboxylate transport response regulator DctD
MLSPRPAPVMFVEDDDELRRAIVEALELAGLLPAPFADAALALADIDADFPGVIVSDIRMEGLDGLEFFSRIRAIDPQIPVILISGHAEVPMAVQALHHGAFDFLTKPFTIERLIGAVSQALDRRKAVMENRALKAAAARVSSAESPLIGESPVMVRLREAMAHVAKADLDVLIEGETGTGKELVALQLHKLGRRRARPFVAVNCGAVPDALAEAELFGHAVDGSGYRRPQHIGRIEAADRGTLFLDEVDSMSPAVQVKMLRVLEEREVTSLGGGEARSVDLRVVAATKRDLREAVRLGEFRQDLFYRLDVVHLRVPPLRERRVDIMPLFAHFVAEGARRLGGGGGGGDYVMSDGVRRRLIEHDWPGNVRELRNFAFSAVLDLPAFSDVQPILRSRGSLADRVDEFEATLIREALENTQGHMTEAIALLDVPRKTLYAKLKRYGIEPGAYRRRAAAS